jgi:nucleotide-binding universal stress UspA family protein
MGACTRTGPVVVEVDGTALGLPVVDYAASEAIRHGAKLILVAPYEPHGSHGPITQGYGPWPPADLADEALRAAVAHVRQLYGHGLALKSVSQEGSQLKVLSQAARDARLLVVGRTRARGPQRLVAAQANIFLAARTGCPVVVVPNTWKPTAMDRKVAVGIDGRQLSRSAVEFAFRTAADREAGLTVLQAQETSRSDHQGNGVRNSRVRWADLLVAETLAGWIDKYPDLPLTRSLTARPVVEALVHEGAEAGLVVLGARAGLLPADDPVARRAVAAMSCPVAIVPHRVTAAKRNQRARRLRPATDIVVTTY